MHPDRAGDLPNVFVMESGEGQMSFVSDRLSESLLTETEGTSVILRGEPTHHGSLPQRYAPMGRTRPRRSPGIWGADGLRGH
ncbi:hypothetical protein [Nesterenkonia pannonica]|uniref:hypothetical protein n=1 Tax=Nesterenkonia pannonica TaxID=1548602 RepID=UPI0021643895|nr:hypothetical protein [Nesterenkonia pannonica]